MSGNWQDDAACKGKTKLFFSGLPQRQAAAVAICATCPVRPECREAGKDEVFGVWGGIVPPKKYGVCTWCQGPMGLTARGGAPKRYCSTRCLYAAKDARRKAS